MKQNELDMLRYRHASLAASENTSRGQRADSEAILSLLDQIQFYQDELDRVASHCSEHGPDCPYFEKWKKMQAEEVDSK